MQLGWIGIGAADLRGGLALGAEQRDGVDAIGGIAEPGAAGLIVLGGAQLLERAAGLGDIGRDDFAEGIVVIALDHVRTGGVIDQVDDGGRDGILETAQCIVVGDLERGLDRVGVAGGIADADGAPLLGRTAQHVVGGAGNRGRHAGRARIGRIELFGIEHLDGAAIEVVVGHRDAVVEIGGVARGPVVDRRGTAVDIRVVDAHGGVAEQVEFELGQRRRCRRNLRHARRLCPGDGGHAAQLVVVSVDLAAQRVGREHLVAQLVIGIGGGDVASDLGAVAEELRADLGLAQQAVGQVVDRFGGAVGVDRRAGRRAAVDEGVVPVGGLAVFGLGDGAVAAIPFVGVGGEVAFAGVAVGAGRQRRHLRLQVAAQVVEAAGLAAERGAVAEGIGAVDRLRAHLAEAVVGGIGGLGGADVRPGLAELIVDIGERFARLDDAAQQVVGGAQCAVIVGVGLDAAGVVFCAQQVWRWRTAQRGLVVAGQLGDFAEGVAGVAGDVAHGVDVVADLALQVVDLVADVAGRVLVVHRVAECVVAHRGDAVTGTLFKACRRPGDALGIGGVVVDVGRGQNGLRLPADQVVTVGGRARQAGAGCFGTRLEVAQHVVFQRGDQCLLLPGAPGAHGGIEVGDIAGDLRAGLFDHVTGRVVFVGPGAAGFVGETDLAALAVVGVSLGIRQRVGRTHQIAHRIVVVDVDDDGFGRGLPVGFRGQSG
ncbi:hypothetical protein DUGA2_45360 [Duganella sp. HH101]|nr:hypothetical protein DUGA2_45360 [Duganella sp. HH101]